MSLPLYIVNAFTRTTFGGNPAAVMPLEHWFSDETLLAIAAQHNLSETAFFVHTSAGITSYVGSPRGPKCSFVVMRHWLRRMC